MLNQQHKQFNHDRLSKENQVDQSELKKQTKESSPDVPIISDGSLKVNLPPTRRSDNKQKVQPESLISQIPLKEIKLESNNVPHFQEIIWEWKSNTDPWSSEPAQWTPYKPAEIDVLEKAYQSKELKVILDQWIVHISDKDMFQQRKDNINQQRQVRRIQRHDKGATKPDIGQHVRMKRFIGGETPKTYTNAFGSLDDYMSFFANRTPEMASFGEMLQDSEVNQKLDILNGRIVLAVIDCIQKAANKGKKKKAQKNLLLSLFQRAFSNFEEFYGIILKAYTMETFLYKQLNKYLRNEDWTQLDELLPYAFCLCKSFQCSKLTSDCNKYLQQPLEEQNNSSISNLILYRGAQFDESSLSCYRRDIASPFYFSWNAVTSTSTNPSVAEFFSESTSKISVIFMIEVSIKTVEVLKNLNMINIKTLSESPEEDEIVLAPGSIFELISFDRDDKKAQIRLRLIGDTSMLALQGKIMAGAMHVQVSKREVARIICHEGNEMIEALQHLRGNRMVEKLELTLCKFNERTLEVLVEVMPTLSKLTKLVFLSNTSDQNNHLETMFYAIRNLKILSIEIEDQLLFGKNNFFSVLLQESRKQNSLTNLKAILRNNKNIDENYLKKSDIGEYKFITCLTTLTLDFRFCQEITDERVRKLCAKGLRYLTSLTSLALDLEGCEQLTDEGVEILCSEGLRYLTTLTILSLSFAECKKITDEGVKSLCSEGLRNLTSLTTLTLDFQASKITDEGVEALCLEGLRYLKFLTKLTLHFGECNEITDEGVKSLCSEGFRNLTSLTTLTLNFEGCQNVTVEGMNVCFEGLKHLTLLTTLALGFNFYCGKTEKGVKNLSFEGMRFLTCLTTLTLHIQSCNEMTDNGIKSLYSEGLKHLTTLKALTLAFNFCGGITDEGVSNLSFEGFRSLTSLTILDLNFTFCKRITNKGVDLCFEGLRCFTSLTSLTLHFAFCRKITDEALKGLSSDGLRYLTTLTTLTLDFGKCYEITDEGMKSLCSKGLRNLTSLTNLTLDFQASKITDEGVEALCLEGLRYLKLLTRLTLDFRKCNEITDKGVKSLCSEVLRYLTSLITLTLKFENWNEITNKEFNNLRCERPKLSLVLSDNSFQSLRKINVNRTFISNFYKPVAKTDSPLFLSSDSLSLDSNSKVLKFLSKNNQKEEVQRLKSLSVVYEYAEELISLTALRYLTSLTTFNLMFERKKSITDEGVKTLCSEGLRYLTSLTTLTLDFRFCNKITYQGVKSLCSEGLRYLTSLTSLTLIFENKQITDEGIEALCLEGLKYLISLKTLTLGFEGCKKLTNKGVKSLCSEGLRNLTSLTTLTLNFQNCQITDEEVEVLCLEGPSNLTSLTTLALNFQDCQITDEGVKSLCSEGLKYLTSLKSLTLVFEGCKQLTNIGVESLCAEGLRYLTSLTTLTLNFQDCQITDEGVEVLCSEGLRNITSLTTLALDFGKCDKITNEGVEILCSEGLRNLTSLTTLALNFQQDGQITDEGMKSMFSEAFKYLVSLKSLNLNLVECNGITSEGLQDLLMILNYFRFY